MSVFKRLLCVLLALVILVNIPGMVPKADAVAAGVIAGTVAIGATAVVGALLSNLGFKPGSNSTAWDNLVSSVSNQLSSLGYIVDGMINVASFKPTDDPEKLKAAIAQDLAGLTAQWLSDEDIVQPVDPSVAVEDSFTYGGITFNISSSAPVSAFPFQVEVKSRYWLKIAFYSTDEIHVDRSTVSLRGIRNGLYIYVCGETLETSSTSYGLPILVQGNDYFASSIATFLAGADGVTTDSDLDVSSVPANFTDIAAAYPDWVASGVADAGTTYLPIGITIPGTVPIPTTPQTDATEATEPSETTPTIVTPDILEGMFGGLMDKLGSILAAILAAIQAIPEKIDAFLESMTTWWTNTIADIKAWIDVKIQSIADWWTTFWADTIATVKALGLTITEFFTVTFPAWITDVKAWALALPKTITDAIAAALAAAFVPAAGYWDAKIAACMAAFPLFNSIITTGRSLGGFFSGLGSRPPIIYIDLGNSASWSIGGTQKFLDLTWYAQYKPTVDTILSGFLWLLFAWRFFLRLPGLLRGEGGTIDRLNTYLDSKSTKDGE